MKKTRVLVLDNQVLTPVEAGGPLRIVNIFANLPEKYEVHYLGVTGWQHYDGKKKKPFPKLHEQIIPLSKPFLLFNNFITNILGTVPAFDVLCSKFSWITPRFTRAVRDEVKMADILVTSHPWFYTQFKGKYGHEKLKVYDSHNCEYALYKKYFDKDIINKTFARIVKNIEKETYLKSDITLACTKEDSEKFTELYGKKEIHVVPNPIDTTAFKPASTKDRQAARKLLGLPDNRIIVFTGSRFLPNIEAFDFIMGKLVPRMKDHTFLIVGTINQHFFENLDSAVERLPPEKMKFENKGMLGYGWFDLEKWGKEGFGVRWTKKKFSIVIKDREIKKIRLHFRSTKPMIASVLVNNDRDTKQKELFFSREFTHREITLCRQAKKTKKPNTPHTGCTGYANIEFTIHSKSRTLFTDVRDAGIAVRGAEYLSQGGWKKISLDETIAPYAVPDNVKLFGKVPTKTLAKIYNAADIAINPIFTGSGLNIKMLDYFASGLPTISTKLGARGLDVTNRKELIICNTESFEKEIKALKPSQMAELGRNARKAAEDKYSKEKIGRLVGEIFDKHLAGQKKKGKSWHGTK